MTRTIPSTLCALSRFSCLKLKGLKLAWDLQAKYHGTKERYSVIAISVRKRTLFSDIITKIWFYSWYIVLAFAIFCMLGLLLWDICTTFGESIESQFTLELAWRFDCQPKLLFGQWYAHMLLWRTSQGFWFFVKHFHVFCYVCVCSFFIIRIILSRIVFQKKEIEQSKNELALWETTNSLPIQLKPRL